MSTCESSSITEKVELQPPKGHKSPLWKYFGFVIDESGDKVNKKAVRCRICQREVGYSGNTTNLRQHMDKWHKDISMSGESSVQGLQITMDEFVKQKPQYMSSSSCRAKQITNSLANFVAKDMCPIALVEGSGFIEFMSVVEPNYKIPSRKHIMEVLHGMYKELHCKVMEDLTKAQWVSDVWTSLAMDSYLGITVHL